MSKNRESQNDTEQRCLDFVKNEMKEKDCFGLSKEHFTELKKWLNNSEPNSNNNNFPDFVFGSGFIEHFAVTSSLVDKKGAKQTRESYVFKKKSETNFLKHLDSSEEEILVSHSFGRNFEKHTHLNIVNSIKKSWIKHIESYDKNTSEFTHRIFLIEYTDIILQTAVSRRNEPTEVFDTYRISVDEHLLDWIYTYKEKIDYLILVNLLSPSIEVIRINHIPDLIKEIPEIGCAPVIGIESHKFMGFKIKEENI
ncbi:hypothetical protein B481_1977 [Planococcus halocryophilus Or1]|nr:hypothetical protein [Planococcus halocryophilus]EMF46250.1 hypothetical protein B481_1977 [Planococcus halocryophilus Or1]